MDLPVKKASEYEAYNTIWKVDTIEELLQKIKDCGYDIILSEDGKVVIYDSYVE